MPRFGGIATMMRLPMAASAAGLDAGFVGVPFDIGTSHRPGARFGPRQIRAESSLLRPYNMATGAAPFDALQVADIGDVAINTFNLPKSIRHHRRLLRQDPAERLHPADHGRRPHDRAAHPACDAAKTRPGRRWCMSTPTPTSTTTCSARRSPTARRSAAPSRKACSTATSVCADRPARHRLRRRRLRLVAPPGLPRGAGRGVLVQVAGAADGRNPRAASATARSISASTSTASIRRSRPAPARPEIGGLTTCRRWRSSAAAAASTWSAATWSRSRPPYDTSGNTALVGANLLYEMLCVLGGQSTVPIASDGGWAGGGLVRGGRASRRAPTASNAPCRAECPNASPPP